MGLAGYSFLRSAEGSALLRSRLASNALVSEPAKIEVPKENFGVRPAVILSVGDRIIYQTLVDAMSVELIGGLLPDVYGWRLPIDAASPGHYARQDFQWLEYRSKLSSMADRFDFGLKADVTSFFASLDPEQVATRIVGTATHSKRASRLSRMLLGWRVHNPQPGLPQRSTASAVLANMMLQEIDLVVRDVAKPVPRVFLKTGARYSFARWMDDIWIFGNDDGALRSGQVDIQRELSSSGLTLNSGKTQLLWGAELSEATKKIQSSAVDGALEDSPMDSKPLEALIDQVLDQRELADRSTVRFISSRMRDHDISYRSDELLSVAMRLPHAADHLGRLFRRQVRSSEMQDWMYDYVNSSWCRFEWATAQFATAITPARPPRRATRELYASFLEDPEASIPLVAVAAQRLSVWDPDAAMDIISARAPKDPSAQRVRVTSLAAMQAGASRKQVREWLAQHDENYLTLLMLQWRGFSKP